MKSYAFKVLQNAQVVQLLRSPERDVVEVPLGLNKSFMAGTSEESVIYHFFHIGWFTSHSKSLAKFKNLCR